MIAIAGIVMCTFGMLAVGGGKLGLVEAVAMSMLLGLSVDYVIHMAESYVQCGLSAITHQQAESGKQFAIGRRLMLDS